MDEQLKQKKMKIGRTSVSLVGRTSVSLVGRTSVSLVKRIVR